MSLPHDEAGYRALEPRCASPHSADSKRIVALMSVQPEACKESFLCCAVFHGLPNLVRCALAAGASASIRSGCAKATPALVEAAGRGNARILKQLLEAGADHSLTDGNRFTALLGAAQEGHLDCIELLRRWSRRE